MSVSFGRYKIFKTFYMSHFWASWWILIAHTRRCINSHDWHTNIYIYIYVYIYYLSLFGTTPEILDDIHQTVIKQVMFLHYALMIQMKYLKQPYKNRFNIHIEAKQTSVIPATYGDSIFMYIAYLCHVLYSFGSIEKTVNVSYFRQLALHVVLTIAVDILGPHVIVLRLI